MVIEPTLTTQDIFTQEQRAIVRTQDHPPGTVVGFIAAVEGPITPMGYWCAKVHLMLGTNPFRDFHFHTVQVGPLIVQILRMEPPPDDYGVMERIAIPSEVEVPFDFAPPIFLPTGNCTWPPAKVLDWDGLVNFTHRGLEMPSGWAPPAPEWTEKQEEGDGQ